MKNLMENLQLQNSITLELSNIFGLNGDQL